MSSQSRLMINNYCKQGYSVLIWLLGVWRSKTQNAHIYRKNAQMMNSVADISILGRGGHFMLVTCNINSKTKWRFWVNDWSRSINKTKTSRCDSSHSWVHRRWCPFNERHTVVSHKCSIYGHFTKQGQPVDECYFYTLTVKNPVWVSIAHSIDLLPFL